jgi:hypothetical protein
MENLPQNDHQFVRVNTQSVSSLNSWTDEDFERMRGEGKKMFDDQKDEIMDQIKIILEEKFNY